MSSGLECEFFEPKAKEWFYVLQDGDCPVSTWDWREFATAYGPFATLEEAEQHLRDNHANPGGYWITRHEQFHIDETYQQLIDSARAPDAF